MVELSLIKVVSSASAIEEVVGLENVVLVDVVEAVKGTECKEVVELEYAPVVVEVVVFQGKVDSAGASS